MDDNFFNGNCYDFEEKKQFCLDGVDLNNFLNYINIIDEDSATENQREAELKKEIQRMDKVVNDHAEEINFLKKEIEYANNMISGNNYLNFKTIIYNEFYRIIGNLILYEINPSLPGILYYDLSFFLYNVIKINEVLVFDRINLTVFAYGLAVAMEYLHRKDIIYNLNLNNVFVFDDCNPFIFESQPNLSCESDIDFMPPSSQGNGIDSKKKDNVYSYYKILYYIVNKNIDEFDNSLFSLKRKTFSYNQNSSNTNNKSYSKWPANNWSTSQNSSNTNDTSYSKWSANNWANAGYNSYNSSSTGYGWSTPDIYKKNLRSIHSNLLIHNCIDEDPNRRPPFSFICDVIEEHHLNYNEDPFIKNYIINLKKFRKPALYKK